MRLINRENGLELSELFDIKSSNFHALKVNYSGIDFHLGRSKTKHPGEIVRQFLSKEKKVVQEPVDEAEEPVPLFKLFTKSIE